MRDNGGGRDTPKRLGRNPPTRPPSEATTTLIALDFPPGGGHRGYAAMADGSGLTVACCCSHSMGDR
jgi:hypothetical protein